MTGEMTGKTSADGAAAWPTPTMLRKTGIMLFHYAPGNAPLCSDYAPIMPHTNPHTKWNSHTNLHTFSSVLDFCVVMSATGRFHIWITDLFPSEKPSSHPLLCPSEFVLKFVVFVNVTGRIPYLDTDLFTSEKPGTGLPCFPVGISYYNTCRRCIRISTAVRIGMTMYV